MSCALVLAAVVSVVLAPRLAAGAEGLPAIRYSPGRGLRIGDTGLTLAGYAIVNAERPEGERGSFLLDELALFVEWDSAEHWHFFSETELETPLTVDDHGRATASNEVRLERLYLDYTHSDALHVRAGKFLTPVGIWNLVHAGPLVWTESRPLATTDRFFDPFATGLMLYGNTSVRKLEVSYSVYGQATKQLVPADTDGRRARRGAGARLTVSTGGPWTLGVSATAFDDRRDRRWQHVHGVDLRWQRDYLELWSEVVVRAPVRGGRTPDWAAYLQAAVPVVGDLYVVGRIEHVDLRDGSGAANVGVPALAYRLRPNILVKTEYHFADRRVEDVERGFVASLAVLF